MKKIILTAFCLTMVMTMSAEVLNLAIDGLWYVIDTEKQIAVVTAEPKIPGVSITYTNEPKTIKVVIPETITYYPSHLENECYHYPVVGIASGAFDGNTKIVEVILPKTVYIIDDGAFYNCSKLRAINLPDGLEYIGQAAFAGCKALKKLIIPASVEEIGDYAFANCSKLHNVLFKNSLGINAQRTNWFVGTTARIESILMPGEKVHIE